MVQFWKGQEKTLRPLENTGYGTERRHMASDGAENPVLDIGKLFNRRIKPWMQERQGRGHGGKGESRTDSSSRYIKRHGGKKGGRGVIRKNEIGLEIPEAVRPPLEMSAEHFMITVAVSP